MPRRQQKLSSAKSRTAWLAWCAWGVFGSIFMFEDTAGGSGVFAWIFTAPFWVLFALWPLLWAWLRLRRAPGLVEIDDDITAGGATARLVQSEGIRYVEAAPFAQAFNLNLKGIETASIPGGGEVFVKLENVRPLAEGNEQLALWLTEVDSLDAGLGRRAR